MSKATHTPGPWFYHDDDERTAQITNSGSGFGRTYGPSGLRIADVWATDLPGGAENAHLIASAPDLLAALQTIAHGLTQIRRTLDGSPPKDAPWAVMALDWLSGDAAAAIAKAEGRVS